MSDAGGAQALTCFRCAVLNGAHLAVFLPSLFNLKLLRDRAPVTDASETSQMCITALSHTRKHHLLGKGMFLCVCVCVCVCVYVRGRHVVH